MDPQSETAAPLILLAEDDVPVREAMSFALRIDGFAIEVHANGEALLTTGRLEEAACLVIDYRLPGITGLETLREIRSRGHACPAIVITTQPKPDLRAAARRLKAAILEKPLLGGELPAKIRELLG